MEWIEIAKDGLPKEEGKYIIFSPSLGTEAPIIELAWYHYLRGWSLLPSLWIPYITHWMKIEPPNEAHVSNEHVDALDIPYAPSDLVIGDYVFACRWSDADWNDPWAVGYVRVVGANYVELGQEDGRLIPKVGVRGFKCAVRITGEQGAKIAEVYQLREGDPFDESVMIEILSDVQ